jgi:outer membrane protein
MKRFTQGILMGFIVSTVLLTAKSQTLTIDEAIEIGLKHSPDVDISRFDFKKAIERNKFQKGYYLPKMDFGAIGGRTGLGFSQKGNFNTSVLVGNLTASQLLYDFGKTTGRIDASNEEASALEASMNQLISRKILQIKALYYDALKMKSIISVAQKNIELQKGQLRRATRYYENGIKTIIDVSDAQVHLIKAELDLSNAQYELKLRRALLEEEIGYVPYNGNYVLYHRKFDVSNINQNLPHINTSLPSLEKFAYAHRYELKSSQYLVKRSQAIVKSEKGGYLPTLSLRGDYLAQNVDDVFASGLPEKQWQAGVDVKWNLFSGYQTDASVQEAKISALKAASQVDDVRLLVKRQVIEASLDVKRTKDSVTLSQSIAKASEKKYFQAKKRYENDLSDYIELQEAQQGYIQSLSELVITYYDFYISIAQLDFAVGR